ncbi:MAG: extracellular solute-binding protein family 1, partial [Bacilli bacterium]|nr:extracellular solute-binding protein family 1 [Bacilli bacterium]
ATGQATLNTDDWVKQYQFMNQFYSIPGAQWTSATYGQSAFMTARTLAMYPFYFSMINKFQDLDATGKPMNWDFTTFPWYSQQPGVGNQVDSHNLSISAASQHKDLDFKIIQYMLSKDIQMDLAKDGKASVLTDPIYQQNFGTNIEMLKGKNMGAVFKTKPQPYLRPGQFDSVISPFSSAAKKEIVEQHNPDIVGVLRSQEDLASKALQTAKAQQ